MSDLVTAPQHSLIAQSQNAEECKTAINADGFGLAWYAHRREPGLYRDVYPAWSDPNLKALAAQVRSSLFLAHVRASTGTAISRNNCHPFVHEHWSFMHNGQVGGFDLLRKQADMAIPDALYHARRGATDSEALFLIALGFGLNDDPLGALQHTVRLFQDLAKAAQITEHLRMTLALSDGEKLYAVRYASNANPPSLYYRRNESNDGWIVVSEPLEATGDWICAPANSFCTFTNADVTQDRFECSAL